jgi:hypothetical protein
MNDRIRQVLVLFVALTCIVSSFWLGDSLDQGADPTPVYFLPFGLTFAIWGLIFSSSLVYAVYQALPGQASRLLHRRIGSWVALNGALTTLWNFTAGSAGQPNMPDYQPHFVAATVFILIGMLYSLTRAVIALRSLYPDLSTRDRWLVVFPVTVFFAWLNVAMIANTTAALDAVGFTGGADGATWAAGMLVIAALVASAVILYTRQGLSTLTYAGVILWALVGIFFNNAARSPLVSALCIFAIVAVLFVTIWHMGRGNNPGSSARRVMMDA